MESSQSSPSQNDESEKPGTTEEDVSQPSSPASETSESPAPEIPTVIEDDDSETSSRQPLNAPVPVRFQLNFTGLAWVEGAEDVKDAIEEMCEWMEAKGYFFDFTHTRRMDDEEVMEGTPVYRALTEFMDA